MGCQGLRPVLHGSPETKPYACCPVSPSLSPIPDHITQTLPMSTGILRGDFQEEDKIVVKASADGTRIELSVAGKNGATVPGDTVSPVQLVP